MNKQENSKKKVNFLIIGARVIALRADRKMRKFLKKKLNNLIEDSIQKAAVFYTHTSAWKPRFRKKIDKNLKKLSYIQTIIPDILSVKVSDDNKGIHEEDYEQKLETFLQKIIG